MSKMVPESLSSFETTIPARLATGRATDLPLAGLSSIARQGSPTPPEMVTGGSPAWTSRPRVNEWVFRGRRGRRYRRTRIPGHAPDCHGRGRARNTAAPRTPHPFVPVRNSTGPNPPRETRHAGIVSTTSAPCESARHHDLRAVLGKHLLDGLLTEREKINPILQEIVDETAPERS